MEKSLKEIIKEVGKEYDLEENIINDVIQKLQKQFYIKLKHMKNLSIDTWKSLDLPINLYYVLYELYQSALSEQLVSQPIPEYDYSQNNIIDDYQSYDLSNEYTQYQTQPQPQPQIQQQRQNYNNTYQTQQKTNYNNTYQTQQKQNYTNVYQPQQKQDYTNVYQPQHKQNYSNTYQTQQKQNYNNAYQPQQKQNYSNVYQPQQKQNYNNIYQPQQKQNYNNVYQPQQKQNYNNAYQPQQNQNYNNYYQKNNNQISVNNNINMINNQNNKNSLQNIIHNDLSLLFSEINNLERSRSVFKHIYTIINNIVHNPLEEKYRRFNISKLLSRFQYKNLVNFFLHIGFKRVDEYMYLVGEAKNITLISTELNLFIKNNKIAKSTFDPFRGSISSLAGNEEQLKRVQTTEVNFEDLYNKEIDRRNIIIKKSKIDRRPKLYELEKNYSINRIINTINQIDDDLISNSNEDKMIIKKNLALLKERENDRFTLRSRTRLEQLMKTPIYVKSDIRLKFPNEQILQGSFALYETIGDIYNFIRNYLKNQYEKFNISTTPPLKRYLKMDKTIQEEKLYPNLLMYVNFDEGYSGLDENKTMFIKSNLELMDVPDEQEQLFTGLIQ